MGKYWKGTGRWGGKDGKWGSLGRGQGDGEGRMGNGEVWEGDREGRWEGVDFEIRN